MHIVFSLYGRPRELRCCLESLRGCRRVQEFDVCFDINDAQKPVNREVAQIVQEFVRTSGLKCSVQEYANGDGADINVLRTFRKYRERILYMAGDVLLHPECLDRYLQLNERFPSDPITLYHQSAHPIRYEADYAVLRETTVESLLLDPSKYLDYCLFKSRFVIKTISTIDWMLNWVFHLRQVPVYSDHFSYVQHLGLSGGMTSSRWAPFYAYDYVDQKHWFEVLKSLGYDINLCKLVRNRDQF